MDKIFDYANGIVIATDNDKTINDLCNNPKWIEYDPQFSKLYYCLDPFRFFADAMLEDKLYEDGLPSEAIVYTLDKLYEKRKIQKKANT